MILVGAFLRHFIPPFIRRSLPELVAAGSPYRDSHGLWVQMDVDYRGSAKMTLETKMNLMKLKRRTSTTTSAAMSGADAGGGGGGIEMTVMDGRMYAGEDISEKLDACFNEDAEDSAESDSEIEVSSGHRYGMPYVYNLMINN